MRKIKISISDKLKEIRTYHDYTQKEIANILNISRDTYADYENNRRIIPLKHLNKLSNFYIISINFLLGLTEENCIISPNKLDLKIISRNLKSVRKELGVSITSFANSLNYGISTISEYENEKQIMSTSFCYDLARKYNISIDWLLGKSNQKKLK